MAYSVKFKEGSDSAYSSSTKDEHTFYSVSPDEAGDPHKVYLGTYELTTTSLTNSEIEAILNS